MDTDPGHKHFFKIYCFFLFIVFFYDSKRSFKLFSFFVPKLAEPFRDEEIFDIISFLTDLGFESIRFLFAVFS